MPARGDGMKKYIFAFLFVIIASSIASAVPAASSRYLLVVQPGSAHEYSHLYRIDTYSGKVWKLEEYGIFSDSDFIAKFGQKAFDNTNEFVKTSSTAYMVFKEPHWEEISETANNFVVKSPPKPIE